MQGARELSLILPPTAGIAQLTRICASNCMAEL